jgi:hypothetical protein
MAQAGPYRGRLEQPVSIDGFMRELQRRRRFRRVLPVILACLVLCPAVAIAVTARMPAPSPGPYRLPLGKTVGAPTDAWGFVVSAAGMRPWSGVSDLAPRPSSADSPYRADEIQAAVSEHASELRDCYLRSTAYESRAHGEFVASMLITKGGEVELAVGGAGELKRAGVHSCVRGVLSQLSFAPRHTDYAWVHLPLRFEP